MAGIFFDGFDHYASANIAEKWTQVNATPTIVASGRRGGSCIHFDSYISGDDVRVTPYPVPTDPTCIVGLAFQSTGAFSGAGTGTTEDTTSGNGVTTILAIRQGGSTQVWFRLNQDGTISAMRGTSVLQTTTFALTAGVYQYLEFKVLFHASAGTVGIRVNNSAVMAETGLNTVSTASATWNEIKLGKFNLAAVNIDDVYCLDGAGSHNNDYLGDTRVDVIFPNAAGNSSQFTRSAGSDQWATIDETAPNSDTDYNETATATNRDSLNFPNAPAAGASIWAVQAVVYAKKTDSGAAGLKLATRMGSTNYDGTEVALATAYNYYRQVWDRRPSDSGAWVSTDVDAAEFGYVKST